MREFTATISWNADDDAEVTYRVTLFADSMVDAALEAQRRMQAIENSLHDTEPRILSIIARPVSTGETT